MFSLTKGLPIAKITGGKYNGELLCITNKQEEEKKKSKKKKYESESSDDSTKSDSESYSTETESESESSESEEDNSKEFTLKDGKLMPIPNMDGRQVVYIAGASGSGKTTYASQYLENYRKMFPQNEIIIISRKPRDPVLDRLKPSRLLVDESIVTDPIDITQDIDNSCCVLFDDANTYQNEKIQKAIIKMMMDILEVGRNIDGNAINIIITSHLVNPNQKNLGRTIFNESHLITIFPASGNRRALTYVMKEYIGFDKETIEKIFKLPSRWVTIHKLHPAYVMHEKGAFLT